MHSMPRPHTTLYGGRSAECRSKPSVKRSAEADSKAMRNHGDAPAPSEPKNNQRQKALPLLFPLRQSHHRAQICGCRSISGASHLETFNLNDATNKFDEGGCQNCCEESWSAAGVGIGMWRGAGDSII